MTVFIDTNVLFAAAAPSDALHRQAVDVLSQIEAERQVSSDHVLIETWVLLASRFGHGPAMRFWRSIRSAPVAIECVTSPDLERAQAIGDLWSDQAFDIVDCTSFAVMERLGCYRVASFDKDFAVYRTGPDRRRAFEIVRP